MLTKKELLQLTTRTVKALGGEIELKELTIKEVIDIEELDDSVKLFTMISKMICNPKLTPDEVGAMPSKFIDELSGLVTDFNGLKEDE